MKNKKIIFLLPAFLASCASSPTFSELDAKKTLANSHYLRTDPYNHKLIFDENKLTIIGFKNDEEISATVEYTVSKADPISSGTIFQEFYSRFNADKKGVETFNINYDLKEFNDDQYSVRIGVINSSPGSYNCHAYFHYSDISLSPYKSEHVIAFENIWIDQNIIKKEYFCFFTIVFLPENIGGQNQ